MSGVPAVISGRRRVRLAVVGGRSAGFAAAIKRPSLARVAMAEGGTLGGTCERRLRPVEALIQAAGLSTAARTTAIGASTTDGRPD